jgi:hypothetical protein
MGGLGSGNRWQIGRDTCESYTRIELSNLRKRKLLRPGYYGSLSWSFGGRPSGDIRFRMHESSIELIYKFRKAGGDWEDVQEHVPFSFTEQHLGGHRRWFMCLSCRRKCAVLYGGTHYRCRKCWNLAYTSQHEQPYQRAVSKAQKLRQRLGGSASLDEPFPPKPKGMHWRTYNSLRKRGERFDDQAENLTLVMFARFIDL